MTPNARVEWPTLALMLATYLVWLAGITWLAALWLPAGVAAVALSAALHSSLCHEALHGHPTRIAWLNEALVFPALAIAVPYRRFRDTHIAHHHDEILTDPYDDPETNYLDPAAWAAMPGWLRVIRRVNNTLAGRLVIGPVVGQLAFMRADLRAIGRGEQEVLWAWVLHVPAAALVLWAVAALGQMPWWAFALATYMAHSILRIRTFLEHRAHDAAAGRTVIIEDRGILAFLFLFNNLHVVHHAHPGVPWYRLPGLYAAERARFTELNEGYFYSSYGEIFRRYLLRAKDPVAHPLWQKP